MASGQYPWIRPRYENMFVVSLGPLHYKTKSQLHITHTHIYIYIYTYSNRVTEFVIYTTGGGAAEVVQLLVKWHMLLKWWVLTGSYR